MYRNQYILSRIILASVNKREEFVRNMMAEFKAPRAARAKKLAAALKNSTIIVNEGHFAKMLSECSVEKAASQS